MLISFRLNLLSSVIFVLIELILILLCLTLFLCVLDFDEMDDAINNATFNMSFGGSDVDDAMALDDVECELDENASDVEFVSVSS